MSILVGNPLLLNPTAGGSSAYQISKSLRFNAGDSAYLSKNFASAGNQYTFTLSMWVKRATLSTVQSLWVNSSSTPYSTVGYDDTTNQLYGNLRGTGGTNYFWYTNAVFRDCSQWYHIVAAWDTANATAANRFRLYVNGVEQTFSSISYCPQNTIQLAADTRLIGSEVSRYYASLCLADIHFIDGQALTPSSFTTTDLTTGQLIPQAYTGSYGTGTTVATATGALPIFNTTDDYGKVKGTGTRIDSNSSSIVLAVAMDGANNGTTFTDQSATIKGSGSAKTLTVNGNTKTSTVQSYFYGSSGAFDGSGDYLNATNADFAFGTGDFTVECWVRIAAAATEYNFVATRGTSASASAWTFGVYTNSKLFFYTNGFVATGAASLNADTWYHVAVTRSASIVRLYLNGIVQDISSPNTQDFSTQTLAVGASSDGSQGNLNGYIQDVRMYKGLAKYTSNFLPVIPSNGFHLPFSDNSTTAALGTDTSGNGNTWTVNNFSVNAGVNSITLPSSSAPPTVEYLVIGGGGGGGAPAGGGGGAGGFSSGTLSVSSSATYALTVGTGGAAGIPLGAGDYGTAGGNGGNSVFASITSTGGGGGAAGNLSAAVGKDGGSGGGGPGGAGASTAGGSGVSGQGFAGGSNQTSAPYIGGGGGGAGEAGNTDGQGEGGDGIASSITGSSVTYAGGGGAGANASNTYSGGTGGGGNGGLSSTAGTVNTGGGGGGGYYPGAGAKAGGSGIVVIRYSNTYADLGSVGGGLTYSFANTGGYKIYTFTASATLAEAAGNDSLTDTPTSYGTDTGVGGSVRGNYCTLNPLNTHTSITLSNGNLDYVHSSSGGITVGTIGVSSGKYYWEHVSGTEYALIGLYQSGALNMSFIGSSGVSVGFTSGGFATASGGPTVANSISFTTSDVIGFALDMDAGTLTIYKNGTATSLVFSGLTGTWFPAEGANSTSSGVFNFGQRAFAYPVSGFKALVDTNLPAPVVAKGSAAMDVALYTGNGGTQTISGLGFNPDFVWFKLRSDIKSHALYDVIRGGKAYLRSNGTVAEQNYSTGGISSFNSDGFTIVEADDVGINVSSGSQVAWAWDAGTSTVTNTAGSITSQVRANPSAGFSIVTHTSTGAAGTVGHGLGVQPLVVLTKVRSTTSNWEWRTTVIDGSHDLLLLNTTGAKIDSGAASPTSTVFTDVWNNGETAVTYCFAPVSGYSSMSSYVGNGSSDGVFVYTGFRPRYIMMKSATSATNWFVHDSARSSFNSARALLFPNLSNAEDSSNDYVDLLSNGFKLRFTNSDYNTSGQTYIYAAFAESPFQYARAR